MKRDLLRQLAAFQAVGTEGTITAAAQRLAKSPPAVHHDLRSLEGRLGQPLFRRVGKYLRLTEESRQLHAEVGRALDKIERDLDRFSRASHAERTLRIGVVAGFGRYRLAPLLFQNAAGIPLDLFTGTHDDVVRMLQSARIDVGITYRPVVATPINCEPIAEERYVLIASLDSPSIKPSLEAVEALSYGTYDEYEYVFGTWFRGQFETQPTRLPRADHVSELEEALEAVACGRGVTITPADAWFNGPWHARCKSPFETDISNVLYLLSMPGQDAASGDFVRGLFAKPVLI